jgi:uncharacterized phosphatase
MRIALVRHGETDWNRSGKMQGHEDMPLNETGIQQAADTAAHLAESSWRAIVSSPLVRARQTAEIIAQKNGIEKIHIDVGFIERDLGPISGMLIQEFDRTYPDGICAEIETWESLQKRMTETLLKYVEMFFDKNFIVVSHGWVIKALLSFYNPGLSSVLKNGGIEILSYENSQFHIS